MTSILHIIHYIAFTGAQLFNSILIVLILKRAGMLFGSYRHILLFFAVCTILWSWVEIFVQPVLHIKGPMFVLFLDREVISDGVGEFLACLHCGTFGFLIAVLAAQFFYRYIALCRTSLLSHLNGPKLFIIFIPCIVIYILWFKVVEIGMTATPEKREYLREELLEQYNADSLKVPFIAPYYWSIGKYGERIWHWKDVSASVVCCIIIIVLSILIIFFAVQIFLYMKNERSHMSQRTLELNRQLFVMLTLQTIVPFCMMYIPVGLFIGLPLFELTLGPYVNYPSASIALYPMIEPLIAIYCIRDFRKTIFGIVCGKKMQSRVFAMVTMSRRSQSAERVSPKSVVP